MRSPKSVPIWLKLLLVVFYFGEFRIHYVAFIFFCFTLCCTSTRSSLLRCFVSLQFFCQLMCSCSECLSLGIDNVLVVRRHAADRIGVAVGEQAVELATVALECRPLIEQTRGNRCDNAQWLRNLRKMLKF